MTIIKELAQRKVEKIHHAFDTAAEKLLAEARQIIENANMKAFDLGDLHLLEKVGFKNCKNVRKAKKAHEIFTQESEKLQDARRISDLVMAYKHNFPLYKFLTVDQLLHICLKYNLVFAPVEQYIGEIPPKNVRELANIPSLDTNPVRGSSKAAYEEALNFSVQPRYTVEVLEPRDLNDDQKRFWREPREITSEQAEYLKQYGFRRQEFAHVSSQLGCYMDTYSATNLNVKMSKESSDNLYIAAPPSMFNSSIIPERLKEAMGVWNTDPVVFRRCKGGIQVITKWGLEASDPLLVNEIEN